MEILQTVPPPSPVPPGGEVEAKPGLEKGLSLETFMGVIPS